MRILDLFRPPCGRCRHVIERHGAMGCAALARTPEGELIPHPSNAVSGLTLFAQCKCPIYVKPANRLLKLANRALAGLIVWAKGGPDFERVLAGVLCACGHPHAEHTDEFGCQHDFMKARGGQELHDYTCSCLAFVPEVAR